MISSASPANARGERRATWSVPAPKTWFAGIAVGEQVGHGYLDLPAIEGLHATVPYVQPPPICVNLSFEEIGDALAFS